MNNFNEIKEFLKEISKKDDEILSEKFNSKYNQLEKRIINLEFKFDELQVKFNKLYNSPFIKFVKDHPIKAIMIFIIILLLVSGALTFDELIEKISILK